MPRAADVEVWRAITAGDEASTRAALGRLSVDWIEQQGESAAALAQAKGHPKLANLLRVERVRVLQTDERARHLDAQLRADLQQARATAASSSHVLEAAAEIGQSSARSMAREADAGGLRGIDPLRRMMRDDASSLASSRSSRSSRRSGGSSRRMSRKSSSRKGRRKGTTKHGEEEVEMGRFARDDVSESGASDALTDDLTDDEMLAELDDMLDAMRHDALDADDPGASMDFNTSAIAAEAAAEAAAAATTAPPPRQLALGDLSIKQLRVLIKALGGEAELSPAMVEKSELVALAASVLADAPLGLIDDVASALGLSELQDVGSRVGRDRRLELHDLSDETLRALLVKLETTTDDAASAAASRYAVIGTRELVALARESIAVAPRALLDEACAELQIRFGGSRSLEMPQAIDVDDKHEDDESWPDPEVALAAGPDDECWPDPTLALQRDGTSTIGGAPTSGGGDVQLAPEAIVSGALRFMHGDGPSGRAAVTKSRDAAAGRHDRVGHRKDSKERHRARLDQLRASGTDLTAGADAADRWATRQPSASKLGESRRGQRRGGDSRMGAGPRRAGLAPDTKGPQSRPKRRSPERPRGEGSDQRNASHGSSGSSAAGSGGGGGGGVRSGSRRNETVRGARQRHGGRRRKTDKSEDAASSLMTFASLKRDEEGELRLDVAPPGAQPHDPYDLSQLSAKQLHKVLKMLMGRGEAPVLLAPSDPNEAADYLDSLGEQVRAHLSSAPLALLDEVCEQISAAAAANVAASNAEVALGSGAEVGGTRKAKYSSEGRSSTSNKGRDAARGGAEEHREVGAGSGVPEDHSHRQRRKRSHRCHGESHRENGRTSSLDRRIEEALNPDREAVEARRRARRLERRIAKALRSEGYGSPPKGAAQHTA
jgi:hypothetical protein